MRRVLRSQARGWSDDPDDVNNPYRYERPPPYQPSRYPAEHPFADENPFPDDLPTRPDEGRPMDEWRAPEPEAPEPSEPEPSERELYAAEPEPEPPEPAPPEPDPAEPWPYASQPPQEAPAAQEPAIEIGEPVTAFDGAADAWNPRRDGERRRPTTAEQAVPWLIGLILALAGIVIVLLALIFTSPNGLVAVEPTATPLASEGVGSPSVSPAAEPWQARARRHRHRRSQAKDQRQRRLPSPATGRWR